MSVVETIEAIRSGLMLVCLWVLAAFAVSVVGAWMYRGVASVMRCPMTVARIVAFVAVSAFCVIRGGAKFLMPPPSTDGTPVVPVMQSRSLVQAHNVSGCINVYFVGDIRKGAGDNDRPNGFSLPSCVLVKSGSSEQTLAHEFGHMLGLSDCYDHYSFSEGDGGGPPLQVENPDLPISKARFRSRPRDWGDETGCGFYASSDTYRRILWQFLMFGETIVYNNSFDIPDGAVECINNNNRSELCIGAGEIGATSINPTNEGVYAK